VLMRPSVIVPETKEAELGLKLPALVQADVRSAPAFLDPSRVL